MKIFKNQEKPKKKSLKDFKPLIDLISKKEKPKKKIIKTYKYIKSDGEFIFNLGDKVICRSNDCNPLLVGHIIEFWDNEGSWDNPIPQIKDIDGKVWGVMGIIRPYSKPLFDLLSKMKPLEQWNHFIPKKYQYTKKEISKKESFYKKNLKNLDKIFK